MHEVEEVLFQSLLKLGLSLLNEYVEKKGTGKNLKADLPYHKLENWNYIFGDMEIPNAYFWEKGSKGESPIKKELNLPKQHFSYLLLKWTQMSCCCIEVNGKELHHNYFRNNTGIEKIFHRSISLGKSLLLEISRSIPARGEFCKNVNKSLILIVLRPIARAADNCLLSFVRKVSQFRISAEAI